MWTFVNLGIIIAIISAVIGLKMHLQWWNWVLAFLSTVITVVGFALLYSPGFGYGGWLMIALPLSPVIFISLWIAYAITGWLGRLKSKLQFGRLQAGE